MRLIFALLAILIFSACTSGRKAYLRGDYDGATLKAISRLRASPENSKARSTLRQAYAQSVTWHTGTIQAAAQTQNMYKWEEIADHYNQLTKLAEELRTCPACLSIIPNPNGYVAELQEARLKAAEVRYETGLRALQQKENRQIAREAYEHFSIAELYFPDYKDLKSLKAEAKYYATLKVLIEDIPVQSQALKISSDFFENKIREFLRRQNYNDFVQFYTPEEAKAARIERADQVLRLSFDEFMIGQTHIRESETEVSRDSVKVGSVVVDGVTHNVYNTVKARLKVYEKKVISTGLLDLKILDNKSKAVLTQEKLPGTYVWETRWATFNGDERALTPEQVKMCKLRSVPPPPPQELFVAFTQPIFGQITAKIHHFYSQY